MILMMVLQKHSLTGGLQSSCSEKSNKIHSNTSAMVGFLI